MRSLTPLPSPALAPARARAAASPPLPPSPGPSLCLARGCPWRRRIWRERYCVDRLPLALFSLSYCRGQEGETRVECRRGVVVAKRRDPCGVGGLALQAVREVLGRGPLSQPARSGRPELGALATLRVPGGEVLRYGGARWRADSHCKGASNSTVCLLGPRIGSASSLQACLSLCRLRGARPLLSVQLPSSRSHIN